MARLAMSLFVPRRYAGSAIRLRSASAARIGQVWRRRFSFDDYFGFADHIDATGNNSGCP